MKLSLRQSLVLGMAAVLLISLLPSGWWLDRRIGRELEARAREGLALAPMRLQDRNASRADALMMHAQEVARLPGLAVAFEKGSESVARRIVAAAGTPAGETAVLETPEGVSWLGPPADSALLAGVRAGESPVSFVMAEDGLYVVSLAPVSDGGRLLGAAGVAAPLDQVTAATLAGLTASEVLLVGRGRRIVASTLPDSLSAPIVRASGVVGRTADGVREIAVAGERYWLTTAPLGDVAEAVFAVNVARELAVLPRLRRGAAVAGGFGLLLALVLGALMAAALARPVVSLAGAADRLAEGDFDAPLPPTRQSEAARVMRAFERMRSALAARLGELRQANRELEEREARLQALQSEMIQRDRLAAAGRLVAELAHEIRNPVANVRNCLEVIHRRSADRPEMRRFADLAIDELLRMHEMAEQMLDLNRPIDPSALRCDPTDVVEHVVQLLSAGEQGARWPTEAHVEPVANVAIAPDVLKQVLLSLVQNAREAMPGGGRVRIALQQSDPDSVRVDVVDEGPGIADDVLPRIFDPFFTTKGEVHGVGLGLFIAEGLVRRSGGRLTAMNREQASGARFRIELTPVPEDARRTAAGRAGARARSRGDEGPPGDGRGGTR